MSNIQDANNPDYTGSSQLNATENGLVRYSTAIVKRFYKALNLRTKSEVLEFGAGTGFLAELFRQKYQISPLCIELDPQLCEQIRSRGFSCETTLDKLTIQLNSIYTSNVLEHIPDDISALREIKNKLAPGGLLAIYVPAHPLLYSKMDEQVGHVRRYKRKELIAKVQNAGFIINKVYYDDFLGFFASWIVKKIGYSQQGLGSTRSLIIYDNIIYPLSAVLDLIGFRFLIGKNLFLLCQKPDTDQFVHQISHP